MSVISFFNTFSTIIVSCMVHLLWYMKCAIIYYKYQKYINYVKQLHNLRLKIIDF